MKGLLQVLSEEEKEQAFIDILVSEAIKTSEIEGEYLSREDSSNFKGGLNAKKYISIAKTSKATATRDLQDLVAKKILLPVGGGRSTRYDFIF